MERMNAAASLVTFSPMTESIPPCRLTGCAAPMLVPGAIAAMCAASVMNTPADPACAPLGATYTTTGMGDSRRSLTIDRVACNSPPGVFRRSTMRTDPSLAAVEMPRWTYWDVAGVMGPWTVSALTCCAGTVQVAARIHSTSSTRRFMGSPGDGGGGGVETAERVGFEPTIPFQVYTLSRRASSTTPASLRNLTRIHNHPPKINALIFTPNFAFLRGKHPLFMPQTILIAEDQVHIRSLLEYKLRNSGYTVVGVEDGAAALEKARAILPSLI